jgi:hypothetical protein
VVDLLLVDHDVMAHKDYRSRTRTT